MCVCVKHSNYLLTRLLELPEERVSVDVLEERVEEPVERVEVLSRLTVEVRPAASVVLTVVRVVPLLFTRLSTVVLG